MATRLETIKTQDIVAGSNVRTQSDRLGELQASIEEMGVLQPITVRELPNGKYEVVTGGRRFAAAVKAGVPRVPCVVRDVDEKERVLEQIVENVQREDLSPLDTVQAIARYQQLTGETQLQVARRMGKSIGWVSGVLRVASSLSKEEKAELAASHEQPPLSTLIVASRAKNPATRRAMLQGEYTVHEAQEVVNRERTNGKRQPKTFAFRVELRGAVVSVRVKKRTATKRELMRYLDQAKAAVAESSKLQVGR